MCRLCIRRAKLQQIARHVAAVHARFVTFRVMAAWDSLFLKRRAATEFYVRCCLAAVARPGLHGA
jgi:hypothetical protein